MCTIHVCSKSLDIVHLVTMIEHPMKLTQAVVLLEVDDILGNHDWVFNVSLHPLKALDALVTGVPGMSAK